MSLETQKTALLAAINANIKTNGDQEITAVVLAPILLEIVNWTSAFFGDGDDLTEADVVQAIAAAAATAAGGITIHSGTADPNDTPPGSYDLGDFYERQSGGGATIGWYQYNGLEWAEIRRKYQEYVQGIRLISGSDSIAASDKTIIYQGTGGDTFDQDTAANQAGRTFTLVNQHNSSIAFTNNYQDFTNTPTKNIPPEAAIRLHSDGTNWYRIG